MCHTINTEVNVYKTFLFQEVNNRTFFPFTGKKSLTCGDSFRLFLKFLSHTSDFFSHHSDFFPLRIPIYLKILNFSQNSIFLFLPHNKPHTSQFCLAVFKFISHNFDFAFQNCYLLLTFECLSPKNNFLRIAIEL